MAKINTGLIPEGGSFGPFPGLDSGTDYSDRIKIVGVDAAGNRTPKTLTELGLELVTPSPTPGSDLPEAKQTAIDALVAPFMKPTTQVDGVIIGMTTPDGDYYKAYGGDRSRDLTLDDRMRIGSNTKLPVHRLIQAQVDAGHISFDDTLDQFVSGGQSFWSRVTIKHLMDMQSGIKDYLNEDPTIQIAYFLQPTTAFNPLPSIRSYAMTYEPGSRCVYSNSNTVLLGKILEWCDAEYGTGRDIRTILTEDFIIELGLDDSMEWPAGSYMAEPYSRAWSPNIALPQIQATLGPLYGFLNALGLIPSLASLVGYGGLQTTAEIEWTAADSSWGGPSGCLAANIADFVKMGEALRDGELLSPEMWQLMEEQSGVTYLIYTPAAPWEGPGWIGMGGGLTRWGLWCGWQGNFAGYKSSVLFNLDNGAVIATMMNNFTGNALGLHYRIAYELYPESVLIAPSTMRIATVPEASDDVGDLRLIEYQDPGDEDGTLQLPHKVPYVI